MDIGVAKQTRRGETRVPVVPSVAKRLTGAGARVLVEAGAGVQAQFDDEAYRHAGAEVTDHAIWSETPLVLTLHPPTGDEVNQMQAGSVLVGLLSPAADPDLVCTLAGQGVTSFSLEYLPRISRAQPMDVLTSQANIAGYAAVVLGAGLCPKLFPMMMTAAGTLAPSRVFVLGVGVAGLQAIATAKRLGAVVEAYDVRAAVKEQVQSLGARFVEIDTAGQDDQATGGYAAEQTQEQRDKQVELMTRHLVSADVVICTAAVFGKDPPLLIPAGIVEQMRAGTVIVDMAATQASGRGNCESTRPDEQVVTGNGVVIEGPTNLPGRFPTHSSEMYANNLAAFLGLIVNKDGELQLDQEDPLVKQTLITHGGEVVHEKVREAIG